jgi:hypothetical protein
MLFCLASSTTTVRFSIETATAVLVFFLYCLKISNLKKFLAQEYSKNFLHLKKFLAQEYSKNFLQTYTKCFLMEMYPF